MLKSYSTQFALTLILGPLGLVYSSVATAVFLTLVLAVLYFTLMGPYAALLLWPVAIVVGAVFVRTHNDQMRQSGNRLLLGPDEEGSLVSTMGSWGRGLAVLSLLAIGGYLSYWYVSDANKGQSASELAANRIEASVPVVDGTDSDESNLITTMDSDDSIPMATVISSTPISGDSADLGVIESSSIITFSENEVQPVVIGTASTAASNSASQFGSESSGELVFVNSEMVNLRDGPGTNFSILDQVVSGEELSVIDRAGSWVNVRSNESGSTGWIFGGLVRSQQ